MESTENLVISAKAKKKTLSFKPKKQVKVLRQVFAAPCERYWPLLDSSKEADLNILLERTLVVANIPKIKLPWKREEKGERTKMKDKRKKIVACNDEEIDSAKSPRSDLLLGLNAVARALEKSETSVVLLTHDLDPPMLGHHISDLCVVKRVPLIVTQSLRTATKQTLGFSCIALGIKHVQTHFTELQENLIELSSIFPIPDGPMYKKVHDGDETDDILYDSDESCVNEEPSKLVQEKWDPKRLEDIYLLRTSRTERAFIPKVHNQAKEVLKFDKDFISFGTSKPQNPEEPSITCTSQKPEVYRVATTLGLDETASDAPKISSAVKRKVSTYMPLVLNVVQSNPDKKKKKKKVKLSKWKI